jgi:hypothetical protein
MVTVLRLVAALLVAQAAVARKTVLLVVLVALELQGKDLLVAMGIVLMILGVAVAVAEVLAL